MKKRDFTKDFAELENFFSRFEKYKPMAVYRTHDGKYSWPTSPEDEADFKDKNNELSWMPALGGQNYMMDFDSSLLMKRDRAEAEALEIAKRLKKALENI